MKKLVLISVPIVLCLGAYGLAHWRQLVMTETDLRKEREVAENNEQGWDVGKAPRDAAQVDSLPALDAHGFNGIQEIGKPKLVKLMTKFRPLSRDENANLNRGCPGLTCVY
jgi:hypothetical protein